MNNEEFDLDEDKKSGSNETGMDKMMSFIRENTKLVIVLVVVLLLIILMAAFSGSGGSNNTGITISEKTVTITTDTGNQLKLMKDGKEVTGVVWTSKDSSIVTIDKTGVIKGLKVGKTTVVGKFDGHEYECEVTVTEGDPNLKVESLKFSESGTIIMPVGSTYQVPIQMTPPEAKSKNKIFSSSNPSIASINIDTGLITANAKGNAMIRVAVNDAEKMASIKIKVVEGQITPGIYTIPTSIALDEKEITLTEGETKTLTYHQEPPEASTDYVVWVSADEEVASVFNGELIAKKSGNIEVAIVSMGLKDTMVVHVKSGTVPVTGINLASEESITMNVGDQKKIVATVEPSNATNQVVTYLVDNPSVVSVDNDGNISAIGSGSTSITISPSSNLEIKKTIYVTVNENTSYVPPTDSGSDTGGNTSGGGETVTVGTVIVTGTNNSISTELPGIEVENTTITMTSSGNVDEIRYCKYDKSVSSSCTPKNIYSEAINLPEVTVTSKKVYVFKIVPMYQGKSGKEIIRYVTIKAGSTASDSPGEDPVSSDGVGELVISGLYDSESDANSHVEPAKTITVAKKGNVDKFKYCRSVIGGTCTSYTTQSLSSGSYTFTTRDAGTYFYEFIPIYNNVEGTKVKKYVKIGTASSTSTSEEHCYVNVSSQGVGTNYIWGTNPGSGYVVQAKALDKKEWCEQARKYKYLCFKDNANNYYWGSGYSTSETYEYQQNIQNQSDCLAKNPEDKCYCNSSHQCRWGQNKDGYTKLASGIETNKNACDKYTNNGHKACFSHNGSLTWGTYMNEPGYTYLQTTEDKCGEINEISYKVDSRGNYHFYCKSTPEKICSSNNVTWKSDNESAFKFNSNSNVGKLLGNSSVTITAEAGTAKLDKEYSLSNGNVQISPAIYSISSEHSYVVNFYNNTWTRENYPMVAFNDINSTYNFDYIDACYYTVRVGEKVNASDVSSKCHSISNQKEAEEHSNRDIQGLPYKYTTYKLGDVGVRYKTRNFALSKQKQRVAFEFGWLTEKRNTGYDSTDVILVLYIGNSKSGIRSIYQYSRVYRISVNPKDESWSNSTNGAADRFKDWTVTEETKKIFGNYYE